MLLILGHLKLFFNISSCSFVETFSLEGTGRHFHRIGVTVEEARTASDLDF